jgi:hypothetical protein
MISIIPLVLFPAFFVPTLIMVRKVFGHSELKYAGYVMALVSAITTTLMLSNPVGFLNMAFSAGIFPAMMVILFACFCLIPLAAFAIMLFVGLRQRFRIHALTDHFAHGIPHVHEEEQWIPEASQNGNGPLGISDVGRQQITRLIRAQKKTDEEEEESGYIRISSEYGDE